MIPAEFEYTRPASMREVFEAMNARPNDHQVIAGGQSLLPLLKLRLATPGIIIDLSRISELSFIKIEAGRAEFGAMTTERDIELSKPVDSVCPVLTETMGVIADPHVRNLGTIGGSVCFADPRGDLPASLLALDATMTASSKSGTRKIPVGEFFLGPFTTALRPDELLTSISVPTKASRSGAYVKLSKRAGDFAVIAVGANIDWNSDGTCRDARISLCAAGPVPLLVGGMNEILRGSRLEDGKILEAARHAEEVTPSFDDPLVSPDYRKAMIQSMTTRALRLARERAGKRA